MWFQRIVCNFYFNLTLLYISLELYHCSQNDSNSLIRVILIIIIIYQNVTLSRLFSINVIDLSKYYQ